MEHRWGERVELHLTVKLSCRGSAPPVAGCLENVSSSGAFVRTEGCGPPRGPVEVILEQDGSDSGRPRSMRLLAYVVRESAAGVGIEWSEFAPRVIRELLVRRPSASGERQRARSQRSARHSSHETNTSMPPCAQLPGEPSAMGASA